MGRAHFQRLVALFPRKAALFPENPRFPPFSVFRLLFLRENVRELCDAFVPWMSEVFCEGPERILPCLGPAMDDSWTPLVKEDVFFNEAASPGVTYVFEQLSSSGGQQVPTMSTPTGGSSSVLPSQGVFMVDLRHAKRLSDEFFLSVPLLGPFFERSLGQKPLKL